MPERQAGIGFAGRPASVSRAYSKRAAMRRLAPALPVLRSCWPALDATAARPTNATPCYARTAISVTNHEFSAHVVTGRACARTTVAMRPNRHLIHREDRVKLPSEARKDSSESTWQSREPRFSSCHSPEIRRLWLTIPLITASTAV